MSIFSFPFFPSYSALLFESVWPFALFCCLNDFVLEGNLDWYFLSYCIFVHFHWSLVPLSPCSDFQRAVECQGFLDVIGSGSVYFFYRLGSRFRFLKGRGDLIYPGRLVFEHLRAFALWYCLRRVCLSSEVQHSSTPIQHWRHRRHLCSQCLVSD